MGFAVGACSACVFFINSNGLVGNCVRHAPMARQNDDNQPYRERKGGALVTTGTLPVVESVYNCGEGEALPGGGKGGK